MITIVAIDPGGTTGLVEAEVCENQNDKSSVNVIDSFEVWHNLELYEVLMMDDLKEATIICESFQYRHGVRKVDLAPVEAIGVIKLVAKQREEMTLVFQSPAKGKGFWKDEKLKQEGFYTSGSPHIRDAMRHLLYYLMFDVKTYRMTR